MDGCAEAAFQLRSCGAYKRDAYRDGIPCESICGKTLKEMRRRAGSFAAATPAATAASAFVAAPGAFSCKRRKTCGAMASCEEARFHLRECGNRRLDRNRDGVPCESLCQGR